MMVYPIAVTVDRTGWGHGPWDDEPDNVQWTTQAGLPAFLQRGRVGAWAGYVGVGPRHPAFRKPFSRLTSIRVHGELSYSGWCALDEEHTTAHELWWVGFDCGHAMNDLLPSMVAMFQGFAEIQKMMGASYRDLSFAHTEVENLARQLADMAKLS